MRELGDKSDLSGKRDPGGERHPGSKRDPGGKRELIKAEAMRLFVERGVDAVSVRDIAGSCAMKPSNLYAHFAARDALVEELFHDGYAAYGEIMAAIVGSEHPFRDRME